MFHQCDKLPEKQCFTFRIFLAIFIEALAEVV